MRSDGDSQRSGDSGLSNFACGDFDQRLCKSLSTVGQWELPYGGRGKCTEDAFFYTICGGLGVKTTLESRRADKDFDNGGFQGDHLCARVFFKGCESRRREGGTT